MTISKLKMFILTFPIPEKLIPFTAAIWASSPRVALKHGLRKAFRVRGIKSFFIDGKEFDSCNTTYTYIVKHTKILEFVKEGNPPK